MNLQSKKGVALALAITMTLIIFLLAAAILNFTYGRFHASAFQTDHLASFYATEAGMQYAFARLADPTFANTVQAVAPNAYIVTSLPSGKVTVDGQQVSPNARTNDLFVGRLSPSRQGREVTVWIQATGGTPKFRVRAFTDYGS